MNSYRFLKRLIDVTAALLLLALLLPLLLLVAIAIRLTAGSPVLFRQRRVGKDGVEFTLYKFRTLINTSWEAGHRKTVEQQLFHGLSRRKQQQPFEGPDRRTHGFKPIPQEKLTPLGGFLRRACLDELPQLFNVLKGEMSLVGPRPSLGYEVAYYNADQYRRLSVLPGLTGLWQVSGRSQMNYLEMIQLDLDYARAASLEVDLRILLKTPKGFLEGIRKSYE